MDKTIVFIVISAIIGIVLVTILGGWVPNKTAIKYAGRKAYVVIEEEQYNKLVTVLEEIAKNTQPPK